MQLSALVSFGVFLLLGTTVLLDQWIIGQASARFMIGTAMLIVGFCMGLFAIISAIGLAVSAPLRDDADADEEAHAPERAHRRRTQATAH
jgi:F0F1-type ATP synthase assembly protein I